MNLETAVRTINSAAFRPGWRMRAASFGGSELLISFEIDTVDTSYPDSDGVCRREFTLPYVEIFDVSELDLNGLFYQVLKTVHSIDTHEDREFLRIQQPDGSWYAPLHPHTPEGIEAWKQLELI